MRSTMLMPVEWAVMRNADTAKLTALARQLPKSSYITLDYVRVSISDVWNTVSPAVGFMILYDIPLSNVCFLS
jgi:hypothetical protein